MTVKSSSREEFVYFMQRARSGSIKIGTTTDLPGRLAAISTSSDEPVSVIGVMRGGRRVEAAIHYRFIDHQCQGEWFSPHEDIVAFIKRNTMKSVDEILSYERTFRHVASFVNSSLRSEGSARIVTSDFDRYVAWCIDNTTSQLVDHEIALDEWVMKVILGADGLEMPELYAVPLRRFIV
jgi:hypothetical protein